MSPRTRTFDREQLNDKTMSFDSSIDALISQLKARHSQCITSEVTIPAEPGQYHNLPRDLDARLASALKTRGIKKLFSHQHLAWKSVREGCHTAVVTPTASGKTLCYNLPVINAALKTKAKALYLFPTKALSQDQVAEIHQISQLGNLGVRTYTFDGDTPGDARKAVRTRGDIVVTNPDMLHQGILPHHTKWAQFFESLHYVVIDEMHTYRGVFGSHMANVLRRLKRICRFYGTQPLFILCSATIANPGELAAQLIEDSINTIDENGAPQGRKNLLLWNPPLVNAELSIRASARSQTSQIARLAVRSGLKSIVFAQTRLMVEVLTKYLKDVFDEDPRRPARVSAYRGGYLPTERRETERQLRSGNIDCVVTTSALELGVDIGALDVCILNGYPGTIAGTWQRLGRAGRRTRPALGILVATSSPLDQYIVRNPEFFLGRSPEHARIDSNQLLILLDHIRCAAFELPFQDGESFGKQDPSEFLAYLEKENVLHHEGHQWHWMADSYPAGSVSLRSVAEGNFVVIDTTDGAKNVIAEVDYTGAPATLYEGAIYMIQAKPWQVERLDWEGRKAFVQQTQADYYTEAIDYTRLKILEEFRHDRHTHGSCSQGEVHLVRRIAGYKKIRYYTHENVGYGQVRLPDQEMHTSAVWWQLTPEQLDQAFPSRWHALDGFLGAAYAMHFVATLLTMSEPRDLGRAVGNSDATWFKPIKIENRGTLTPPYCNAVGNDGSTEPPHQRFSPTVFLYDNYPGGMGLSDSLYTLRMRLVNEAHTVVAACGCSHGCPACIGPILASEKQRARSAKNAALQVLQLFAKGEKLS